MEREQLWSLLHDPVRLAQCIPGCEKLHEDGPDHYTAMMKIGVAAVKGTYAGKVAISEKQPPSHYKLSVEGSAAPGFVRGIANMDLSEKEPGKTLLSVNSDAQVGGLLASVGQRFLSGIAKQMLEKFFQNIEDKSAASPGVVTK
jgi:carbon monoxide dehydrogenase subunit G